MNKDKLLGFFCLLYGTIFWGLVWYPYRLLEEVGVPPVFSSFLTFSIATIISLIFIIPRQYKNILKDIKSLFLYATLGCITNLCYVLAVVYGEVVRSMLLFFMSPLWTICLSYFILPNDKFSRKDLFAAFISLLGGLIILIDQSMLIIFKLSDFYAIVAGFAFAGTNVLARKFSDISYQIKSFAIWLGVVIGGFFICLILGLFSQVIPILSSSFSIVLFVGVMLFVSTLIIQFGLPKINPVKASPIFLFEIIVAALSSYFIVGEYLSSKDFLGGGLIIISLLLVARN